jgi:hypothetical protein
LLPISLSPEPAACDAPRDAKKLTQLDLFVAWVGLAVLALTVLGFLLSPASTHHFGRISPDGFYKGFTVRLYLILAGGFLAAFCLVPVVTSLVRFFRERWRSAYTCGALLGICAFLWVFILHFGRWQFGGFDYNIMVETGWRQIQGQRPYVDFPTTTPPGFNLGIKYAYQMFGINWDANLYLCSIFACLTFLWMYWLMLRLAMGRLAAATTAFAIECAAMLTLCFWWYNDSVLVLAAVFFLSCLAYACRPESKAVQASYFLSLTLLSLMKPNMAGVTIVGGVILLFVFTDQKIRLVLLTLGATVAAVGILLVNHVSIPAMLASYLSVAKGRGNVSDRFGYRLMNPFEQASALLWVAALSVPLLGLAPRMVRTIRERDWQGIAYIFFFPLGLLIALYGLSTNSDCRDLECTVLLAAGAVLTFGLRWNGPLLRRFMIAIVFATMAGDLYYGAARERVYGIGLHGFFEWQDNGQRIESGFFKNMRVSSKMIEVEREVKLATGANPGPYFFGPRMEFNYAALGLPSPMHSPTLWDPGTAFPVAEQAHLIQVWQEHGFQTLIFLNSSYAYGPIADRADYTFYPREFRNAIERGYVRDEQYPLLTVYHRRAESGQP